MDGNADAAKKIEVVRGLEYEVAVLLRRIRRVIGVRARMVHPDLSPVAYSMMAAIAEQGPRRASDLVDVFTIDKGAVSRHMAQLIDLGLVERHVDPKDGRALLLSLTPEGEARFRTVTEQRRTEMVDKFTEWSVDEFELFWRLLREYNETVAT